MVYFCDYLRVICFDRENVNARVRKKIKKIKKACTRSLWFTIAIHFAFNLAIGNIYGLQAAKV